MPAYIIRPGGSPVPVKNLGWILRHWREVDSFRFYYSPVNSTDGVLSARMKDGRFYRTDFASLTVCFRFLRRSVFDGLSLTVLRGAWASPVIANYPERTHEISSEAYRAILAIENRRGTLAVYDREFQIGLLNETLAAILP